MKSLWGDLSSIEEIETPQEILNTQASFLNSSTDGIVLAKLVKAKKNTIEEQFGLGRDDIFKFDFLLTSPKITSYSYRVFRIEHDVKIYPVFFKIEESIVEEIQFLNDGYSKDGHIVAKDEKEFLDILEDVLSSKVIIKVIGSLISLSKSI